MPPHLHPHDYDYHFVAIKPTQLEVYSENGSRLFDFRAEGTIGFKISGKFLKPIGIDLPWPVPRVHLAKNIGPDDYYEILFESKHTTDSVSYSSSNSSSSLRDSSILKGEL